MNIHLFISDVLSASYSQSLFLCLIFKIKINLTWIFKLRHCLDYMRSTDFRLIVHYETLLMLHVKLYLQLSLKWKETKHDEQ